MCAWPEISRTKYAPSVKVAQRDDICVISESPAKFCGPKLQLSNMRCRLKLGDAQNLKHQVRAIGESAAKLLWRVTPSVKHGYRLKFGDAFVAQLNFQVSNVLYR